MKKTLLLTSLLLALTVSVALAGGVNLAWGTVCYTEAADLGAAQASTFACTTNGSAGNRQLTASFVLNSELADMVGSEMLIEGDPEKGLFKVRLRKVEPAQALPGVTTGFLFMLEKMAAMFNLQVTKHIEKQE